MTDFAFGAARRSTRRGRGSLTALFALATAGLVAAPVGYMLWPQPAAVRVDAPTLPIIVGGVVFNVPPAAIRVPVQRRTGAQARVDLSFVWPTLNPPPSTPSTSSGIEERLFVTIAASDGSLSPLERLKTIYPRYIANTGEAREGLTVRSFRTGTPYQGEELVYDPAAPERFILRCTLPSGASAGTCLHERRLATADVTVRFSRDWLTDWRAVESGIDRLFANLRPAGA